MLVACGGGYLIASSLSSRISCLSLIPLSGGVCSTTGQCSAIKPTEPDFCKRTFVLLAETRALLTGLIRKPDKPV